MIALLRGLRRAFSPGKNDPLRADAADLLRVGCTIAVAAYHIWQQSWLNPAFSLFGLRVNLRNQVATGYLGVDLLLMLSGFLLYLPYAAGHTPDVRGFYRKRAARILPSYWFCLLIMLAFAAVGGLYASAGAMFRDLLAHATFTHNLSAASYVGTPLNGALWTLSIEVQFYLIFPVLGRAFERRPYATYAGMIALSLVCHAATMLCFSNTQMLVNQLPNMLDAYANGMLAAVIYRRITRHEVSLRGRIIATAVCALSIIGVYYCLCAQTWLRGGGDYEVLRLQQLIWRTPLTLCAAAFVVSASLSLAGVRAAVSNPVIRFLSGISFNFYMWHQYLAVWLKKWRIPAYTGDQPNIDGQQPWQNRYTLICFAAALLAATALTYLVEKPCAKWIRNRRKASKN